MFAACRWYQRVLLRKVDGASLGAFRISFGLVIVWQALELLIPSRDGNWIERLYVRPAWNFPFPGFSWVRAVPEPWMTLLVWALALAGLLLAAGCLYRLAAIAVFGIWTYLFLIEATFYQNHFYLMCLLAFVLIWMPADRCFSFGRWLRNKAECESADVGQVPFWTVFLLRAQMFLVYFYAGVAKLNPDWVNGYPMWGVARTMREELLRLASSMGLAAYVVDVSSQDLAQWVCIAGLVFDLAIGFMLVARRMRPVALVLVLVFHAINTHMFQIGVFPVLATLATLIFCDPDWPRKLGWAVRRIWQSSAQAAQNCGSHFSRSSHGSLAPIADASGSQRCLESCFHRRFVIGLVTSWVVVQALLPLRHFMISGDANWTEEGDRFSWRMMLRTKEGVLRYEVVDPGFALPGSTIPDKSEDKALASLRREGVYIDIDSRQTPWATQPGWYVIFEPLLGERLIYVPSSTGSDQVDEPVASAEVVEHWRVRYDRDPHVASCISLREALDHVVETVGTARLPDRSGQQDTMADEADQDSQSRLRDQPRQAFVRLLIATRDLIIQNSSDASVDPRDTRSIARALEALLSDASYGPVVRDQLHRTYPFAILGNTRVASLAMVVEDRATEEVTSRGYRRLVRDRWPHVPVIYSDFGRMEMLALRHDPRNELPQIIAVQRRDRLVVEWNYHRELEARQIRELPLRPYFVWQYAGRIASEWEAKFGRRPQVYAHSFVLLNSHPAERMIDPRADLAETHLDLWGRNRWILLQENEGNSQHSSISKR